MGNVKAGYMLGQAKVIITPTASRTCCSSNSIMNECNINLHEMFNQQAR